MITLKADRLPIELVIQGKMSENRTLVLYVVATGCVWQNIEREKETDKETERDRKSWNRLATKK